jgi:hypothetical protein
VKIVVPQAAIDRAGAASPAPMSNAVGAWSIESKAAESPLVPANLTRNPIQSGSPREGRTLRACAIACRFQAVLA